MSTRQPTALPTVRATCRRRFLPAPAFHPRRVSFDPFHDTTRYFWLEPGARFTKSTRSTRAAEAAARVALAAAFRAGLYRRLSYYARDAQGTSTRKDYFLHAHSSSPLPMHAIRAALRALPEAPPEAPPQAPPQAPPLTLTLALNHTTRMRAG